MRGVIMIKQLADPANAITATGLMLSMIAIYLALQGRPSLAVAVALWALLADHLDGVVATRTRNRRPETGEIGKSLDSLADLVCAGIFPAVILMVLSNGSALSVLAGTILVVACALRLSYFNVFGSPGGRFIGVPTTYAVPLTTVLFLARPFIAADLFPPLFAIALLILAICHVAPIRVPKTVGAMYAVVTVFCVASSAALALRDTLQ
jgi:CDP-diacylglycerol--serine O-phosphatidyltransferase